MLILGMCSDYATRFFRHSISAISPTTAIIVLLALPINAGALSCAARTYTLSEAYAAADSIIVGLVTECEEEVSRDVWTSGGSGCSFVSLEALKESEFARDYGGVASSSACGLSLQVGHKYLLFLDRNNKPMRFSASLTGEPDRSFLAISHARILREYRDRAIHDLSEPWIFREYEGSCSLSHVVGGNIITFGRAGPDALKSFEQEWTRETVGDKTIYRSTGNSITPDSGSLPQGAEFVVSGDMPEYPVDTQMLSVVFQEERPPHPERQASVSVGSQTWPLYRMESTLFGVGMPGFTHVEYKIGGDQAEMILAAMSKPSDIVVSAVLVNSGEVDSQSQSQVSQGEFGSVSQSPQDNYFSQFPPETSQTKPAISSSVGRAKADRARSKPPEPVLRLETRSTQLPEALESYKACYESVRPKTE